MPGTTSMSWSRPGRNFRNSSSCQLSTEHGIQNSASHRPSITGRLREPETRFTEFLKRRPLLSRGFSFDSPWRVSEAPHGDRSTAQVRRPGSYTFLSRTGAITSRIEFREFLERIQQDESRRLMAESFSAIERVRACEGLIGEKIWMPSNA